MKYLIDPEFQARLPEHTPMEHDLLAEKMGKEGCLSGSIVVGIIAELPDAILIDGHNTLKICGELSIEPPEPRTINFTSKEHALKWMIENQFARRNCTAEQRSYYIGKEYLFEKSTHGGDRKSSSQNEHLISAASEIAEKNGVSESTVRRDAEFAEAVDATGKVKGQEAVKEILAGGSGQTKAEVVKAAPKLCRDCRLGKPKKGCKGCKEIRSAEKGKQPKKPRKVVVPPDAGDAWEPGSEDEQGQDRDVAAAADLDRDMLGHGLPKKLVDFFNDDFLREASGRMKFLRKHVNDNQKLFPWILLAHVCQGLETLEALFDQAKPYAVHQKCAGNGCDQCRASGFVPKWRHDELEAETR